MMPVLIAAADVVLVYLVARHIFRRDVPALVAAGLLLCSPVTIVYAGADAGATRVVPCVLAWLWCITVYLDRPRLVWACGAAACLAVAACVHPIGVVLMVGYLLVACVAASATGATGRTRYVVYASSFIALLVALVVWRLRDPSFPVALIARYHLYDARLNVLQGLREITTYTSMTERSYVYWDYFDPSLLYLSAGNRYAWAAHAGMLPYVMAVLVPIGVYRTLAGDVGRSHAVVLVGGLLVAPWPGTLVAQRAAVHLALVIAPFAALLATVGVEWLLVTGRAARMATLLLLVAAPVQGLVFLLSR